MLTVILGFATSLVYGFADFFGAIAARRINAVLVTFLSGISGLLFLLSLTPALGASFDQQTLFWGISAGIASAFAMTCLYASLAIGPISIVSPLGAVVSAIVPAAVGFALGERFGGDQFITHRDAGFEAVQVGDFQCLLRQVYASDVGAFSGDRFGEDASATANVNHALARERNACIDPLQTKRIDFMQRTEFRGGVPPAMGQFAEFLQF